MQPRYWTAKDTKRLREMAEAGISSADAAKQLRRSPGSTRFKAMSLKIRFSSISKGHSRKQRMRWA